MKKIIVLIISLIIVASESGYAGTCGSSADGSGSTHCTGSFPWNADSTSYEDVNHCVNNCANEGDLVIVPSGTATWTSTLAITKGIALRGAGAGSTTITNGGGMSYIITVIPATPADNPYVAIMGFTFDANNDGSCILVQNHNIIYDYDNFRIHHNMFKNTYNVDRRVGSIWAVGMVFGLIDHNTFQGNFYHIDLRGYEEYSWDKYEKAADNTLVYSSLGMGGARFLFVEDNFFTGHAEGVIQSGQGARWVSRYNTIDGTDIGALFDIHGDTNNSGCVAVEIYENTETAVNDPSLVIAAYRGGTAMIYNNTGQVMNSPYPRLFTKIREETPGCGLWKGYDMKVHNGYMWNNKNTAPDPDETAYIMQHTPNDYDPGNCLTEQVDYWADTQDGSQTPTTYFSHGVSLPGTCSVGDCYAVETGDGTVTALYRCVDTANVWVKMYEPYTYPHPLQVPRRVSSLKIVVN